MCNLYQMTPKGDAERAVAAAGMRLVGADWQPGTVGPLQAGAYLVSGHAGVLQSVVGQWGMIRPGQPARQPEKRYQTNNARIESVAEKPTYRQAWARGQRCLIPAEWYAEPNWETGKNTWWHLKRADAQPWFLAGLWSEWTDKETGEVVLLRPCSYATPAALSIHYWLSPCAKLNTCLVNSLVLRGESR